MAIVRKDKVLSGYNGNLESVLIHNAGGNLVASTNGVFVNVEGLMEGERELKKATLAEDGSEDVLLIDNPEVMYDERLYKKADYVIDKGVPARAYRMSDGDIITFTEDLFNGAVAVGDVLTVTGNGKLGKADEEDTSVVTFTVIEDCGNQLDHSQGSFAVEVKRN